MRLTKPSCSARCAAALHAIALVPTSTLCTRLQSIFLSSALPVTPPEHRLKKPKCLPYQHIMHTAPIHLLVICTSCYTTWTQIQEVLVPTIPAHCAHDSSPSSCHLHFLLHHLNTDSRSLSAHNTSTLCTLLQSIFLSSALPVTPPEHRLKKPKCLPYQHIMHTAPIHLLVICTSCYTTWTQIQEVLVPTIPAHCAHCSSPSSCQQHFLLHHLNTD